MCIRDVRQGCTARRVGAHGPQPGGATEVVVQPERDRPAAVEGVGHPGPVPHGLGSEAVEARTRSGISASSRALGLDRHHIPALRTLPNADAPLLTLRRPDGPMRNSGKSSADDVENPWPTPSPQ